MSPSDSSLHRDVPPPLPCPQAAGDPCDRFALLDVDGMRRHLVRGDDSTSGVDGVEEEDVDMAPFNGVCSSLSWRRISSVATPPHPPLSLEPSAEILPASSSTPSFGVSTVDSFSTSILDDRAQQTTSSTIKRRASVQRRTTFVYKLSYSLHFSHRRFKLQQKIRKCSIVAFKLVIPTITPTITSRITTTDRSVQPTHSSSKQIGTGINVFSDVIGLRRKYKRKTTENAQWAVNS